MGSCSIIAEYSREKEDRPTSGATAWPRRWQSRLPITLATRFARVATSCSGRGLPLDHLCGGCGLSGFRRLQGLALCRPGPILVSDTTNTEGCWDGDEGLHRSAACLWPDRI